MLIQSMVAASTAATDHATARSRMRAASTSRRSGSSCLLSFRPRTGRSGERITAAATTGPNKAPRPTSSTPATATKPRARNSRSSVPSQRNPANGGAARIGTTPGNLFAFAQTGSLALEPTQIIQLGAAHATGPYYVDMVDHPGIQRENTLHALAEAHLAYGDGFSHADVLAGKHRSF